MVTSTTQSTGSARTNVPSGASRVDVQKSPSEESYTLPSPASSSKDIDAGNDNGSETLPEDEREYEREWDSESSCDCAECSPPTLSNTPAIHAPIPTMVTVPVAFFVPTVVSVAIATYTPTATNYEEYIQREAQAMPYGRRRPRRSFRSHPYGIPGAIGTRRNTSYTPAPSPARSPASSPTATGLGDFEHYENMWDQTPLV